MTLCYTRDTMKKPINKPMSVRIPDELQEHLTESAKTLRRTKASIIIEAIENHFNNHTQPVATSTRKKAAK